MNTRSTKSHRFTMIASLRRTAFVLVGSVPLWCAAQNDGRPKPHGDSLLFNGVWYPPAEYAQKKAEFDRTHFETWLMPGIGYTYFKPERSDSIGTFSGFTVEYLIYAKINQDDNPGPSHVRVYTKLNILNSDRKEVKPYFMYTVGVDMSLEKNPKRNYLVPWFGLEMGGMSQNQIGTTFQFTPTFGLHVLSKRNLFVSLHGGYVYPLNDFEVVQGWLGQASVDVVLW